MTESALLYSRCKQESTRLRSLENTDANIFMVFDGSCHASGILDRVAEACGTVCIAFAHDFQRGFLGGLCGYMNKLHPLVYAGAKPYEQL